MVAVKKKFSYLPNGEIDLAAWLEKITAHYALTDTPLLKEACRLAESANRGLTTFYGQPCIEQSLEMAEIILDLKLDPDAVAAAILTNSAQHTRLPLDIIHDRISTNVANLVQSFLQLNAINILASTNKSRDTTQIDRLRKVLLAMASDIRVVIIKLAERTCIMRGIKKINPIERKHIAQETMDIYAPLANRLGIGQLKWELEDLAFHYIDAETYKKIASFLSERRVDREARVAEIIHTLTEKTHAAHLQAKISGRAKHIYSIYLKTNRKDAEYKDIYDYSAVRMLVPNLEDCYTALSIVHSLWQPIPAEFDDYISKPKPNGYRSIHTAVIGPDGKNLEIQIRTLAMHEEAEHGVAAHWLYKENKAHQSGYENKITFLRQLLAWHKDVAAQDEPDQKQTPLWDDRIYVFTPAGEIIDLPLGATPLDFAYSLHSDLGHRCRGAKINGHIVQLTQTLQTGDRVELITTQQGAPSRDWLNKELGYITTSRARSKIARWFKHQDVSSYIESGRNLLERELARAGLQHVNFAKVAARFNFKEDAFFAALGHGNLRPGQVVHLIQAEQKEEHTPSPNITTRKPPAPQGLQFAGTDDLLIRIARCCKPVPGDKIAGYITQGRGVSIHREDCKNLKSLTAVNHGRNIEVSWDHQHLGSYYADLQVRAYGQTILKEIPALIANLKMDLIALHSSISKRDNMTYITMTVQISEIAQLTQLAHQLKQLPNVATVKRIK